MILHLVSDNQKFDEPYIEFINKNFDKKEHIFFTWGDYSHLNHDINNVFRIRELGLFSILQSILVSKKIIVHSLFVHWFVVMLLLIPNTLRKTYWIVWGGDLYCYKNRKKKIKYILFEILRAHFIRNIRAICTLIEEDYYLARVWYNTKAKYIQARYVLKDIAYANLVSKYPVKACKYKQILVGNSATTENRHIEVFKLLEKYKNEELQILCPLSYGDSEYRKKVIKEGSLIFGNKFHPITTFMESKDYIKLLSTIDVAIFNNNRQQALGNLYLLMILKKKIYVDPLMPVWKNFTKNKINLYNINNIQKLNYIDFLNADYEALDVNNNIVLKMNSEKTLYNIWCTIFND